MPAAKTLEQLTAKFQAFLDPETLNTWGELRELRSLLQKIDTDIAQQRNIEKKSQNGRKLSPIEEAYIAKFGICDSCFISGSCLYFDLIMSKESCA